jgi:hypothetical protein
MKIAFDGTTLQPRRTGVGYYTEHLLHHLADLARDPDELVVISNRQPVTSKPLPAHVQTRTSHARMVRLAWMQAAAPGVLRDVDADVAHFTNGMIPLATRVPTVVTIHDVSLTLYPECHPKRRLLLNRPLVRMAANAHGDHRAIRECQARHRAHLWPAVRARARGARSRRA